MPKAAAAPAAEQPPDELVGLQRLGDSYEWGEMLAQLLELGGWTIHRRRAFAGNGVLLIATHPDGYDLRSTGPSFAAAISPLFIEAVTIRPSRDEDDFVVGL